jgi:hypothetical protein
MDYDICALPGSWLRVKHHTEMHQRICTLRYVQSDGQCSWDVQRAIPGNIFTKIFHTKKLLIIYTGVRGGAVD